MSPLNGKRHLQFELLELRAMLTGNVLVSVVDGDLRVDGDDRGNVLEFQQLSSSDPRAVGGGLSFRITPDADTSINRNDPGVGIVVARVTRDIDVDMGGGGDELAVLGATGRRIRDLLIDAGSGPDAVSITRFRLSRDVSVSAADSLDLSVRQIRAADVFVKIDDIQGESEDGAAAPTSSVTIRNSRLRGNVNVSSEVPLAVRIHGTNIAPNVCKTPAPPAPFIPCGYVNISSGAPLSVSLDQTRASDVYVKIDDIQGESEDGAAAPTSSVTIRNSRLRGNVNVSSEVPLAVRIHGTNVAPVDVCKTPAPPAPFIPTPFPCGNVIISSGAPLSVALDQTRASDVYVKIDDIQGESQDGAAAPTSSVTIRNSRLRGNVDVSSDDPLAVRIHGTNIAPNVCKTPAPPAPFAPCGNVNISSGAPLSVAIDQTRASDVFVKIDDIQGESQDGAAAPTSSVTIRNSRLRGNVDVSSDDPLAVRIHGTIFFPDVCKTPAPPAPFAPCGNVNISSGAPLSVAIDQTRASDVFVKIDDIQGESQDRAAAPTSSVTIRNSRLRGDANISSNAPLAVAIDQTRTQGDVLIKAEGIPISSDVPSSKFANSIRIVDSVFGSLSIVGSELRDELEFVRLHVLGRSHIETGGGDDSLTAFDTVFGGFAFLDGGDDTDSLILHRTRFPRGSRIVNWE